MRLGCSTILFGGFPFETALRSIGQAGYAAIELAAIPSMANHLADEATPAECREIARQIADSGLAAESIGASTNLLDSNSRSRFERLLRQAPQTECGLRRRTRASRRRHARSGSRRSA